MSLNQDQKDWIMKAIEKGFSFLEVKTKLQKARYNPKLIDEMLEEFEAIKEKFTIPEEKRDESKEKEFEKKVNLFIRDEDTKELSWSEKRSVKKFLKNITQYQKVMKKSIDMIKKEIELFSENVKDEKQRVKEEEYLKKEIIDRIIDSKEVLDIEHPITGEDVTKENLNSLNITQLIELMEENVEALQIIVDGKL